MIYIATFFSHYGAMRFKNLCDEAGLCSRKMPVPRQLSSSCGTCVQVEAEDSDAFPRTEEMEQVALEQETGYAILWEA